MLRARLLYLAALGGSVVFAIVYDQNRDIGFMPLYALLLLLLFSLASVLSVPLFLRITQSVDRDEIFKGESLCYRVRVKNKGVFSYAKASYVCHSTDVIPHGEEKPVSMSPGKAIDREYALHFPSRGVYRLGVRRVAVTDLFGLFRFSFAARKPMSITVFPRSDEDYALTLRKDAQSAAMHYDLYNEDYTNVADVRKYTQSDSLRKIHWKLTAKRGELIVKNYQSYDQGKTVLYLDARPVTLPAVAQAAFEDKMVSYVAAAVDTCMQNRTSAELVYGAAEEEQAPVDPADEPGRIYRLLAEIPFQADEEDFYTYCDQINHTAGTMNMILFLSGLDGGMTDTVRNFLSFGHNVFVYHFHTAGQPVSEAEEYSLDSLTACGAVVNRVEI